MAHYGITELSVNNTRHVGKGGATILQVRGGVCVSTAKALTFEKGWGVLDPPPLPDPMVASPLHRCE